MRGSYLYISFKIDKVTLIQKDPFRNSHWWVVLFSSLLVVYLQYFTPFKCIGIDIGIGKSLTFTYLPAY